MQSNLVCAAIRDRKVLQLTYSGQVRRVEPHLVGYDADGDLTLHAWQLSGTRPGWRNFHLSKATELATIADNFSGVREGYNPSEWARRRVLCQV
jgi:predicted DNA-binding transcriptional regulator YafY